MIDASQGNGLAVHFGLQLGSEPLIAKLVLFNRSAGPISDFAMQFNKNVYGLVPVCPISEVWSQGSIAPGQSATIEVPIRTRETHFDENRLSLQVGIKCNVGLFPFFTDPKPSEALAAPGAMEARDFATQWKAMDASCESAFPMPPAAARRANSGSLEDFAAILVHHRFLVVAQRVVNNKKAFYGCFKTHNGVTVLYELLASQESSTVTLKSPRANEFQGLVKQVLEKACS